MTRDPDDPFDLEGKSLRRVIPQVRKNIAIQRTRVFAHFISFFILLAIGWIGTKAEGVLFVISVGCLMVLPFSIFGIFADHHLMRLHQKRLAECERRLRASETKS